MALLSTLVSAIAKSEGLDETYVAGVARYLREAGLITQAGRGRGAAHMTGVDAVHLLIGVNASPVAKTSPEVVVAFATMRLMKNDAFLTDENWSSSVQDESAIDQAFRKNELLRNTLCTLLAAHTPDDTGKCAGDRMADVLIRFQRPRLECLVELSDYRDPNDSVVYHQATFMADAGRVEDGSAMPDRVETVMITQRTLRAVGQVLAR